MFSDCVLNLQPEISALQYAYVEKVFFGKEEYFELLEYMIARSRFPSIPHMATIRATGELKISTIS